MKRFVLPALLATLAMPAMAHVTANPATGLAGKYFQTSLRVTHGCDGSPTVSITVTIPDGVMSVHPQAKPGWKISMKKHALDHAMDMGHGKMAMESVNEITWSGELADDQYDDFGLVMKLPDSVGQTLWFPTVQTCTKGENRWVEIPKEGQDWHDVPKPAPFVKLIKAGNAL
ncbi:MAG TPA: YcnI family protein [Alphaproteobacteria bacterium]|nr:YcnI family protein [Alphaproteobacteria bacterium]